MFKKMMIIVAMLLAMPSLASAWYVNSKTSPLSGQGTITPAGNMQYQMGVDSGEYTVIPATGFRISRVTLDGVAINPNSNGRYIAPYAPTKTWRYIVAYFTSKSISITTIVTGSGTIREDTNEVLTNIPVGSNRQILVIPNPGYAITSLTADGATITDNPDGGKLVVYNNLQTSQTISATFSLIPVVTVEAGNDVNINGQGSGFQATLYGSASSNVGAITYSWSGTGLTFDTPTQATTKVWAANPGNYTATLTVVSSGITRFDTVNVTVLDRTAYLESLCAQCHLGTHPKVFEAYDGGRHKTNNVTCQACHDPNNGGHYSVAAPECSTCHTPPPHGPSFTNCANCHDAHSGSMSGSGGCNFCHGYPPQSGAHKVHFGLISAASGGSYADLRTLDARYSSATMTTAPKVYAYGCANCHSVDRTNHMNDKVDVLLYEQGAPAGSIKARAAATASFDSSARTCSGTYCHSTGQENPLYKVTPAWELSQKLACNSCHGNPPAYPTGGPGTATANSHLDLADDGYETGHFLGMAGPWMSSKHGDYWSDTLDANASAITCQTCHYETTDPSNTGSSGFYYLDTTGNYTVPGGDSYRISSGWQAEQQCGSCHTPGSAAGTGTGKVLPFRHVNGKRDVIFDKRESLPSLPWLPAAPNRPTKPYWMTSAEDDDYPSFARWDGTTLSFDLKNVTYDHQTKTCSNTVCHLADTAPVWGRKNGGWNSCGLCHKSKWGTP